MFLDVVILLVLFLIFIQDIKERSVFLILYPISLILFILKALNYLILSDFFIIFFSNLAFIFIVFLVVSFYYTVKEKKIIYITKEKIAWGDILFYIVICATFSTLNYILFYFTSIILLLLFVVIISFKNKKIIYSIPLAGFLSLFLMILYLISMIFDYNFYNDSYILNYI